MKLSTILDDARERLYSDDRQYKNLYLGLSVSLNPLHFANSFSKLVIISYVYSNNGRVEISSPINSVTFVKAGGSGYVKTFFILKNVSP